MIKNFQLALFTATVNLTNKIELVNRINKELNDLFNGEPLIMPLPDNAPLEIPRIVLKNKDEGFVLNISPMRIDLFFNNKKLSNIRHTDLVQQMKKYIEIIANILINEFSSSFIRVGVISVNKLEVEKPLVQIHKYLNETQIKVKIQKEIQLHFYTVEKNEKSQYNNWIRLIAQEYDPARDGLTLINDMNLINQESKILNIDQLLLSFEEIFTQMQKNISFYA